MSIRHVRALGATALLVAALAACGSSSHAATTPVTVYNVSADPGQNLPATDTRHRVVLTTAILRSTLDSLFSKHVTLVAVLMHQVGEGDASPTEHISALAANSQALTDVVARVYGRDGARAFGQLWEQHTQFFIDYAHADHVHSNAAKHLAQEQLLDYQNDFASFVTTATASDASLTAVTELLHAHVHDLTSYIDTDVAGHDTEARQILIHAVATMHVIAKTVSDAIAAQHLRTVAP
ncbi:MAG: hypothetical protein M3Q30_00720 [Actinomycetota bacterium]|nr:hypothetical protein [Actinomycetota bacterium]